jgi:hypothetical protein
VDGVGLGVDDAESWESSSVVQWFSGSMAHEFMKGRCEPKRV